MLFTGSKNIDPSPSYRVLKIAKYIQLGTLRPRALLAIISKSLILTLENVKLLTPPTVFELETSYLAVILNI